MHDIKWIRDNPALFDEALKNRGLAPLSAKLLELDRNHRNCITELQEIQAKRNAASKEIGKAKASKDEGKAQALMKEVADLKDALAKGEADEKRLAGEIRTALEVIPNLPLAEVPVGADEKANKEVRKVGTPPKLPTNKPLQHFEIGEAMGLMDFETASKVSGARFVFLKGEFARLERALANFMLDTHTGDFGYTEVVPPMLVRSQAAYGTGNLPKFEEDLFQTSTVSQRRLTESAVSLRTLTKSYRSNPSSATADVMLNLIEKTNEFLLGDEPRWLIPTAEVPLTNLVREAILDEAALPMRFTAWTPCFRSEAGAAGKDTRGMIRQHQFSKVELVSITTPEQSLAEHERMTECAETILKRLGLAYRTIVLCTGDMGFASQKTYDVEVWLPGQNTYREISSCSVCGDFQARRMNARYRVKGSKDIRYVHTLNGSGLAVGRTLIAILENYQQTDGSVTIPEALRPYMGGKEKIGKG